MTHRHLLRKAKPEDTIDTLEIGRVASGDATKFSEGVKVAELHDIRCLVALEVGIVRVLPGRGVRRV